MVSVIGGAAMALQASYHRDTIRAAEAVYLGAGCGANIEVRTGTGLDWAGLDWTGLDLLAMEIWGCASEYCNLSHTSSWTNKAP